MSADEGMSIRLQVTINFSHRIFKLIIIITIEVAYEQNVEYIYIIIYRVHGAYIRT